MNIHIVHDGRGSILSVHRSVDGLAHFLSAHGGSPSAGPEGFSIERLGDALSDSAIVRVSFSDEADVVVERHALLV